MGEVSGLDVRDGDTFIHDYAQLVCILSSPLFSLYESFEDF